MAASHRAAKLEASSLQTPENPSTGAQVAQYEREDPLEALAAGAVAAALEEEEEDEEKEKAVLPARARVMQGRVVGWGWVSAGCWLRAGPRPRWAEGPAGKRGALSSSSLPSKPGPPPLCPTEEPQNRGVGKSFNF